MESDFSIGWEGRRRNPLSMEYDYYRNRAGSSPYEPQIPTYRPPSSSSSASPFYPRIGLPGQPVIPPAARAPPYQHTSAPSSSGTGIRVAIKSEHRITPPPPLSTRVGEIPRSNFHFDFDLERKILAEAEKQNPNWSQLVLENVPSRPAESVPSVNPTVDPVVSKYIASGLNREAVNLAVANYGDNPTKVQEFAKGYNLLREMGFSSNSVADALFMYENDSDKALAHFLNNAS